MHLPDFALLVVGTLAAIAAGLALVASSHPAKRIFSWIAGLSFGGMGVVWSATSEGYSLPTQISVAAVIGAVAAAGLTWALWEIRGKDKAEPALVSEATSTPTVPVGQGGQGGSGEIFGKNGTIVGGRGGRVGAGGTGRGGDGGGGVIHGDGGVVIGGEGGSVDGTNIWYPPAQSAYIQFLESQGKTPDFGVQYPGAGGSSAGWAERQQIVLKIREEYFISTSKRDKIPASKIDDVPLEYINAALERGGYDWRARVDRKYWYLYYVPESR